MPVSRFVYAKGTFLQSIQKWWFFNGERLLKDIHEWAVNGEDREAPRRRLKADATFWIKQLWRRKWLDEGGKPADYPKTDIDNAAHLAEWLSLPMTVLFFSTGMLELPPLVTVDTFKTDDDESAPLAEPKDLGQYPEQHRAVPVFRDFKRLRRKPARYSEEF